MWSVASVLYNFQVKIFDFWTFVAQNKVSEDAILDCVVPVIQTQCLIDQLKKNILVILPVI